MSRGGHREKAGRKSTWKSGCRYGETKLIRVPTAIADQVLEIAHKLDSGEPIGTTSGQLSLPIFTPTHPSKITSETLLSGTELSRRLGVSSAAFTSHHKKGKDAFANYSRSKDPDGISWERLSSKKYCPINLS
jgi:hypothetical protein